MTKLHSADDRFLFFVSRLSGRSIDKVYRWRWVWLCRKVIAKFSGRSDRRPR